MEHLQERAVAACHNQDKLFEAAVQASDCEATHTALAAARATAMDALVALHAEQEAQAQEEDDEDEEEEEEEIEGQAQEGVGGRSSIVLRADGRVRRCTAGRAASRFLPEEIAAQPQWQSKKRPRDDQ